MYGTERRDTFLHALLNTRGAILSALHLATIVHFAVKQTTVESGDVVAAGANP